MSELLSLKGRTALVTGAGQGVGEGIARLFAAHDARVVVNDFRLERAQAVAASIDADGGEAIGLKADVTDLASVQSMVDEAAEHFGAVDVLVNNAGNAGASRGLEEARPFWETGPADWAPWMGTNFYGVLNCARAVVPHMVEEGRGRIVTIVSDAGRVGEAHLVVYSGAKAGAAGFMRGLAKAVGRHGITANCVALSAMRTPATESATADSAMAKRVLSAYVIRRFGEPEDAAAMSLFLASDAAAWITGQTYPVNGGYSFAV